MDVNGGSRAAIAVHAAAVTSHAGDRRHSGEHFGNCYRGGCLDILLAYRDKILPDWRDAGYAGTGDRYRFNAAAIRGLRVRRSSAKRRDGSHGKNGNSKF